MSDFLQISGIPGGWAGIKRSNIIISLFFSPVTNRRFRFKLLTANYRLRANLQRFRCAVGMGDRGAKHHTATSRFLFAAPLKHPGFLRESVLHVDVTFFQNAHAIARHYHILGRIHVHLDHDRAVDLALHARRRIFAAHAARLIKHVGRYTAEIRANENLKRGRFVVADQADDRESVPGSILHRPSRAFRLVTSPVLLLRLTDNLQLRLPIGGRVT